MNPQPSANNLQGLVWLPTDVLTLPSSTSIFATDKSLCLWSSIDGPQEYRTSLTEFSEDLLSELVAANPSKASTVHRNFHLHVHCLEHLIHSFAHAVSYPYEWEAVGISMSKNDYSAGRQFGSLSYGPMRRVVEMLSGEGSTLCRRRNGTLNRATGDGVRTRLIPHTELKDRLVQAGLVWSTHPNRHDHPNEPFPLKIRYEDNSAAVPLHRPLTELESVIPRVNERLKDLQVEVHYPDYATYLRQWDAHNRSFKSWMSGNQLYRQFKFDQESGGRLYGHFVQGLPKGIRQHLTIDGLPVVEYDYKAMQLHLGYAQLGLTCGMAEPYVIPGYGLAYKEVFKAIFTRVVGTNEEHSLDAAFAYAIRETLGRPMKAGEAKVLSSAFWEAHEPLRALANTEAWRRLQLRESEISLTVLTELESQGIVCIPIHDGFIVQTRHDSELEAAMKGAVSCLSSVPTPRSVTLN